MSLRPYWQFYKDCFPFIFGFALLFVIAFGWIIGSLVFSTVAVWIGYRAFGIIKASQFYFYFNLGITKANLLKRSFIINLFVAIPITIIFFLISMLVGTPRLT